MKGYYFQRLSKGIFNVKNASGAGHILTLLFEWASSFNFWAIQGNRGCIKSSIEPSILESADFMDYCRDCPIVDLEVEVSIYCQP